MVINFENSSSCLLTSNPLQKLDVAMVYETVNGGVESHFGGIVCSSLMRGVKTCFCDNNFLVYGGCNFLDQILQTESCKLEPRSTWRVLLRT